ncbi:helix-turn-helix transcriptional regulator [Actinokineospora enzanensis]|uniref:helix-turn-helix transcriptional regulator n=1 Tax=Actinokineospora enzanensis TaxID=155975 RepID=UPI000377F1E1|nr:LuxR family transcriptional regulator [Actinokineospora enzanensis]
MLVGRERETALVVEVLRSGGALVVHGEAGIGKTALLSTVPDALRAAGSPGEVDLPFAVLHQVTAPLLGSLDVLPGFQAESLRRALGMSAGPTTDLAVCAAAHALLVAVGQPVVVDDVQDVDPASRQVLLFAARRSGPAMFFATRGPALTGFPDLRLDGLSERAAAVLLPDASPATVRTLVEATGGNPLALQDFRHAPAALLRSLLAGESLASAYSSRFAALPESERETLAMTAATGRTRAPGVHIEPRHYLAAAESEPDPRRSRALRALAMSGPDEQLAGELEEDARTESTRGAIATAARVLLSAARLSTTPEARERRQTAAAHAAWKSGHPDLAREIGGDAALRGMIESTSGDQRTAFEMLSHGGNPWSLPMAVDAARHAGMLPEAAATARLLASIPGYDRLGSWLAAAVTGTLDDHGSNPWTVLAAAPSAIRDSGAHRWLLPMAISSHGTRPAAVREFGLTALDHMRRQGMLALIAPPLIWLAETEYRLGLWDESTDHAQEALRTAHDCAQPVQAADAHSLLARLASARGDTTTCKSAAAAALSATVGNRLASAQATRALATLALSQGDHAQAATRLSTLSIPNGPCAHPTVAHEAAADLTEALVRQGNPATPTTPRCAALLNMAPDHNFPLALDTPTPFERARTALLYGQWLRRSRRPTDARIPLTLAADLFTTLRATPWLTTTQTELRACGTPTPPQTPAGLTPQEQAIAHLAATGLTNRQIAARLHLSPRTIGYHLHKIYPKLGIKGRTDLHHCPL